MISKKKLNKLGIQPVKLVSHTVPLYSTEFKASSILDPINKFLTENNIEDATVQLEIASGSYGDEYYFDGITIEAWIDKTEQELEKEVDKAEVIIETNKKTLEQQRINKESEERELYLKLQKKYGGTGG